MPMVRTTWAQAEALGIVYCSTPGCGHRTNNHFDFGPCAFCSCKKLRKHLELPGTTKVKRSAAAKDKP